MEQQAFIVVDSGRCFRFTRSGKMYVVEGVDIQGVTTQGRTFEEALRNAHNAACLMEEFHAEMATEVPGVRTRAASRRRTTEKPARRTRAVAVR